jgi:hypothetical protein
MPASTERVEDRYFLKATGSNQPRCHIRHLARQRMGQNSPSITEFNGELLQLRCSFIVPLKLEHHAVDVLVVLMPLQKAQTFFCIAPL